MGTLITAANFVELSYITFIKPDPNLSKYLLLAVLHHILSIMHQTQCALSFHTCTSYSDQVTRLAPRTFQLHYFSTMRGFVNN